MTDDPWAAFRGPKQTSDDPWASFRAKPTDAETPEQKTDKLSTTEKFARGAAYGLLGGAEGLVNSVGKAIPEADPKKLAKLQELIGYGKEAMGVRPEEYAPASQVAHNSNLDLGQRVANIPRSVVEMAGPAAVGGLVGGLPGAVAAVGATEAGPTVDRVREADKTPENVPLTTGQQARVAGKVGLDMLLAGAGGKATFGAAEPIMATGLAGLKQAVGNTAKAVAADAAAADTAYAADKGLVEGKLATPKDLVVGALEGGVPGAAFRGPKELTGGFGARENIIKSLDPEARTLASDVLNEHGDYKGAAKSLQIDLSFAGTNGFTKGTKKLLAKAKADLANNKVLDTDKLDAIARGVEGTQAGPEVLQTLKAYSALNKVKSIDDGGVSGSNIGQAIKPFGKWPASSLDLGALGVIGLGGHLPYIGHIPPEAAIGLLAGQTGAYGAMRGIDMLTGASNVQKLLNKHRVDTPSTPVAPTPTPSQAKTTPPQNTPNKPPELHQVSVGDKIITRAKADVRAAKAHDASVVDRVTARDNRIKEMKDVVGSDEGKSLLDALSMDWTKNDKTKSEGRTRFEKLLKNPIFTEAEREALKKVHSKSDIYWTWKHD